MVACKYGIDMRSEIRWFREIEAQNKWIQQRFDRTGMNYNVLKEWFKLNKQGKTLVGYFESNAYKNIAVYGMTELGQFLVSELSLSSVYVKYGIDRRAEELNAEVPILTMEDELPMVDVVVVSAVFYFDEIASELQNKIECPVISLEDVLYSMEQ